MSLQQCETVIMLLTKDVLYQPDSLYVVYCAIIEGKLLIPVHVDRGGYDYAVASDLLSDLVRQLRSKRPDVLAALEHLIKLFGKSTDESLATQLDHIQQTLAAALPNLIAISWQPQAGRNHTLAVIDEITSRITQWQHGHRGKKKATSHVKKSWGPIIARFCALTSLNTLASSPNVVHRG